MGGGLGYLHMDAGGGTDADFRRPDAGYFYAERQGISPYLEAGVEFLRTHRGRLALVVRADIPTGSVQQPETPVTVWDSRTGTSHVDSVIPARSKYVVPLSIGLTVAF